MIKTLRPAQLRLSVAAVFASLSVSAQALDTTTIVTASLSPDCLDYKNVGTCYWLFCSYGGCRVCASVKVRHYIPDAVVSSYQNTGENP